MFVFGGVAGSQEPMERRLPEVPTEGEGEKRIMRCPTPMNITLKAPPPTQATPNSTDFPPAPPPPSGIEPNFGGTTKNRHFRHTFSWKPLTDCCQYLSGTLTLTYEALSQGQSTTSPNAGNDSWSIWKNGTVQGSGYVYTSFPFQQGQTGTITIQLTPAMLAGNRLSFLVQDDTSVKSATLNVVACCVRK